MKKQDFLDYRCERSDGPAVLKRLREFAQARFYTLAAIQSPPAADKQTNVSEGPITVGIGPVEIPDYLERPQVVIRTAENEIIVSEYDRWGGPDTSIILFIVGASSVYSWVIARYQVTDVIVQWMASVVSSPLMFLIIVNLFLLLVGCFIDATPALFILTPVFMPMIKQYGIDPIHFGVMMVLNLMIGLVTPPVGTVLYTLMRVTGVSMERLSYAMIPWYVPLLISLALVTVFPTISTWLPSVVLGR